MNRSVSICKCELPALKEYQLETKSTPGDQRRDDSDQDQILSSKMPIKLPENLV